MKSGKMTVYYDTANGSSTTGSSDIDRLEVEGQVYIKSEGQVATGDRGSFDMKSEVLVLSGDEVVLTEGENVVVGCKLTVQMTTGQAQLDGCAGAEGGTGRVKMLLQPGSQNR
jgi:lipopolysaccharide export system protein LptA